MDLDALTYEQVTLNGRPYTLWSNGRLMLVIRGGIDNGGGDSGGHGHTWTEDSLPIM